MAHKYVCDKCHAEFSNPHDINEVGIPFARGNYEHLDRGKSDEMHKDLCDRCLRALHEYLKPDPKQSNK